MLKGAGEQAGALVLILGCPCRSSALDDDARIGRTTVALNPGTLRQPSSSSCMPSRSTNSGLIMTISPPGSRPTEMSTTKMRSGTPDLRRRQPDARRGVHRLDHVVDQPLDLGRDDRRRRWAFSWSSGVAVFEDRSNHGRRDDDQRRDRRDAQRTTSLWKSIDYPLDAVSTSHFTLKLISSPLYISTAAGTRAAARRERDRIARSI